MPENRLTCSLMDTARSEKEKTVKSKEIHSAKAVVSARNGLGNSQRTVGVRKHLKKDTSKITFNLSGKSSCLYNTTARIFSQESKYSFGNTQVVNCLPRKEMKPLFRGNFSSSSSKFVVEWLPSEEKSCNSLKSIKSGKMLTDRSVYECRIVDKTSFKKTSSNSLELADSSKIKRQEILSRFREDDESKCNTSDGSGNVDSINENGKEIVSLNKLNLSLKGLKSIAEEGIIFQDEKREQKLLFGERHEEISKPLKLEKIPGLKNEEDDFQSTKGHYSLDIKTLLNFNPSNCLYSSKILESKRAISGTNKKIFECPAITSTRSRKTFQSFSLGNEKSRKPVSFPSKPVKPVRLKLKHRQDKFMNERKETSGLTEYEEGRILPITLSAWKKNSYSVMTPYMAKVVWSVMEDELTS